MTGPGKGKVDNGVGEIRTHEGLSPLAVFKTAAFNHSATTPGLEVLSPPGAYARERRGRPPWITRVTERSWPPSGRGGPPPPPRHLELSQSRLHRLEIHLVLQPVEHLVADHFFIPQLDQRVPFRGQCVGP